MKRTTLSSSALLASLLLSLLQGIPFPEVAVASSFKPTLLANTEAFLAIDDADTAADISLKFGDTINKTLTYERSLTRFKFDDDVYITNTLGVAGVASGAVVRGQKTLASSGTLVWEGQGSGAGLYLGGTFEGVGLTDCDTDVQTLAWDSTLKRFGCGDDDQGGGDTPEVGTSSFSGAVRTVGDAKYVLNQGDTMTGSLTLAGSGHLLLATTAVSGSIVRTATAVDSTNSVGSHLSMTIGTDGLPVMSYFDDTTDFLVVLKCGNLYCTGGNVKTNVDTTAVVGGYSSIVIGPDGFPMISYYDTTNTALKMAKCGNAACSTGNTLTTVDNTGNTGTFTSIAVGADGFPIITYRDSTLNDHVSTKCGNATCSSGNVKSTINTNNFADYGSVTVAPDGLPVVATQELGNGATFITKCGNAACSTGNVTTTIDAGAGLGYGQLSIQIGADGLPSLAYQDWNSGDLKFLKCSIASCATGNTITTVVSTNDTGHFISMAIAPDGIPVIAMKVLSGLNDLQVVKCADASCVGTATVTTVDSTNSVGDYASVAIAPDGLPVVAYYESTNANAKFLRCADAACSKTSASAFAGGKANGSFRGNGGSFSPGFEFLNTNSVGNANSFRSLNFFTNGVARMTLTTAGTVGINATSPEAALEVAGTISGVVIIPQAFSGAGLSNCVGGNKLLWTQSTGRFSCTTDETGGGGIEDHYVLASGDTMTGSLTLSGSGHLLAAVPALSGSVTRTTSLLSAYGGYTSLAIGTDGLPVIAYWDFFSTTLGLTKCGNATCTAGNISSPVESSMTPGGVSIAIGPRGFPVIAYTDSVTSRVKVATCADVACASGTTIADVDDAYVGYSVSIAIPPDGLPVISYANPSDFRPRIAKCGNVTCTAGNVTSYVDTTNGTSSSVAIGADGLPVISYWAGELSRLRMAKCGNAACTQVSIMQIGTINGLETSIAIGADGFPVIAFTDLTNSRLAVAKCTNIGCTSSGYVLSFVDTVMPVNPSLAIGRDGLPVIAYRNNADGTLRFSKCGNAACSFGNTSSEIDTVSAFDASVAIGADGLPVVAYVSITDTAFKVARCADTTCSKTSASVYTGGTRIGPPKGNERSYVPAFESVSAVSVGNPSGFRNLSFFSNGMERMTITPSGFIGINTTAPREALEVAGNILIGAQADARAHIFAADCACLLTATGGLFGSQAGVDGVFSAAVYQGKTYVGTNEANDAAVYRYDGGTTWTLVTDSTLGKIIAGDADDVDAIVLTPYNGKLYAGTQTAANTGALYAYDGTTWSLVNATRGTFGAETARDGVSDLHVWNGRLYAATQEANLASVYLYNGGTTFLKISANPGRFLAETADADAFLLTSFAGRLWIGAQTASTTGRVYMYNGNTGSLINTTPGTFTSGTTAEPDVTALTVYNGQLFVGTGRTDLANIYLYKSGIAGGVGADVFVKTTTTSGRIDETNDATDIDSVTALRVYNGRLYAGSNSSGLAALYEYTGVSTATTNGWTLVNSARGRFGKETAVDKVTALLELNGTFYIGTEESAKAAVYSFTKTDDNSYGLRFASTGSNFATMSFVGQSQAQNNAGNQGNFIFTHPVSSTTGAFDYAEDYPTSDTSLEAGEIVAIDAATDAYVRRATQGSVLVGVVSMRPGFRLQPTEEERNASAYVPIALKGRVPVRVSTENGAVRIGDPLTASSVPGVAMKATKAGAVIGRALGAYDQPDIGSVLLFVNADWFPGE